MRVVVIIFLFLSPFCLKAQLSSIEINQQLLNASNTMLLSYQGDSFLISGDSIYTLTSDSITAKAHHLELLKYNYVHKGNQAFLVNDSNGIVYAFDGQNFERLDQSFEFKTQHDHFPFIREGTLHTFGGYGCILPIDIFSDIRGVKTPSYDLISIVKNYFFIVFSLFHGPSGTKNRQ
ncbi:hypothetical protein N8Z88_02720 [Flavobacteriaceae bacterium]|nr:hypothetical protein [Flavobacteriaceae bacterium]